MPLALLLNGVNNLLAMTDDVLVIRQIGRLGRHVGFGDDVVNCGPQLWSMRFLFHTCLSQRANNLTN